MNVRLPLLLFLLVVATSCAPRAAASPDEAAAPVVQSVQTPEAVVTAFLNGWNSGDYATMYSLLSPQSQALYAQEVFTSRYEVANKDINFSGITFTLQPATTQGTTAVVKYDATITSPLYGEISDPGRTMRLVQTPQGWRVAWTSMDIFEGLAAGARLTVESDPPPRGNIYDRNGRPIVDSSGTMVAMYAIENNMRGVEECIDLLAQIFYRQRQDIARWFTNWGPETRFYLGELDLETYTAWESQLVNTCAVDFTEPRTARTYYGQTAFAHVTGYVGQIPATELEFWEGQGYRFGDLVGLAGIERAFQDELAGKAARFVRITEPGGTTLRDLGSSTGETGVSITLTIDRDLQTIVMRAMNNAYAYALGNWGGLSFGGAAVVIDVNSGAILALISYPSYQPTIFNPDTPEEDVDLISRLSTDVRRPLFNRATQEQYFPGSTYKLITIAAALNEGIIGINDTFDCQLEWRGGQKYGDVLDVRYDWRYWDGFQAAGEITPIEALTASCDPFFYEMGAQLFLKDRNLLVNYSRRMGLGTRIGLPLLEAAGDLASPPTIGDAINNAIGQGDVRIPPVQMAQMVAAVANGGTLYKAYLVKQLGDETFEPEIAGTFDFNEGVLDIIKQAMCAVTTDENLGTASLVFDNTPYTVCGKTGTAETSQYPNAWFVAYAPAENPQIAIVVIVDNSREGSEVAAPIIRRILDNYYNAPEKAFPEWWEDPYEPLATGEGRTFGD